jgi:hypothetical protein
MGTRGAISLSLCARETREPRTKNQEPRTPNPEPTTKNQEPRTKNPELKRQGDGETKGPGEMGTRGAISLSLCSRETREPRTRNQEPRTQNPKTIDQIERSEIPRAQRYGRPKNPEPKTANPEPTTRNCPVTTWTIGH